MWEGLFGQREKVLCGEGPLWSRGEGTVWGRASVAKGNRQCMGKASVAKRRRHCVGEGVCVHCLIPGFLTSQYY